MLVVGDDEDDHLTNQKLFYQGKTKVNKVFVFHSI